MSKNTNDEYHRLVIFILIMLLVILTLFAWTFWIDLINSKIDGGLPNSWVKTLKSFPSEAVGTAFLTFLLTEAAQEWYGVRNKKKEAIDLILDGRFIEGALNEDMARRVLKASIGNLTKTQSFAADFVDIIDNRFLNHRNYRENYRITSTITNKDDTIVDHYYYYMISRVEYTSIINEGSRDFYLIYNNSYYKDQPQTDSIEYRYLTQEGWVNKETLSESMNISSYFIDGEKLTKNEIEVDGKAYKTSFFVPEKFRDGKPHKVSYTIMERVLKLGHQRFFHIRVPTHGFYCEIDYSQSDICYMNCFDLLASRKKANIERIPSDNPFKVVVDLEHSWIIPGSGVFLTWQRKSERHLDYDAAARKFKDRAEDIRKNR